MSPVHVLFTFTDFQKLEREARICRYCQHPNIGKNATHIRWCLELKSESKIFSWKLSCSTVSAESWVKNFISSKPSWEVWVFQTGSSNKTKSYQCLDDKEGLCCHTYSCLEEFLEEIWSCKCNCICLFACLFIRTPSKKCNYLYFFQISRNWKGRQEYVETFIIQILVRRLSVLPDLNL